MKLLFAQNKTRDKALRQVERYFKRNPNRSGVYLLTSESSIPYMMYRKDFGVRQYQMNWAIYQGLAATGRKMKRKLNIKNDYDLIFIRR